MSSSSVVVDLTSVNSNNATGTGNSKKRRTTEKENLLYLSCCRPLYLFHINPPPSLPHLPSTSTVLRGMRCMVFIIIIAIWHRRNIACVSQQCRLGYTVTWNDDNLCSGKRSARLNGKSYQVATLLMARGATTVVQPSASGGKRKRTVYKRSGR